MATVLALGVVVCGEVWWLQRGRTAAEREKQRRESVERELRTLSASHPAPTSANVAALTAAFEGATGQRAALRARVWRDEAAARPTDVSPADAYFTLAGFVEQMRERATEEGITLQRDERFGFAGYVTTGPRPGEVPTVMRDCRALARLLTTLFAARPKELMFVQRERQSDASEGEFEMRGPESVRRVGFIEGRAFRVGFRARTATLRVWLNELSRGPEPFVVRAVEVTPGDQEVRAAAIESGEARSVRPVVEDAWSRFTVTVEYLEPAASGGTSI